ncbi:hypothetical protein Hsero_1798 [Herbaspirillum seropedicae SmR1]|uniref:Uncharacterized protein n=1 Tax=Herbaspirillum seropedicae (strain SmR1) TaxID=757424 RepID=D8IRI4_HERSS|nr:hypothetical protein Hsero_1798 [Herbaspirillum seropedicae SmR1]
MVLVRHAGGTAVGQQAHALAHAEGFVGILGDGAQFAVIQAHGDFQAGTVAQVRFGLVAQHAAGQCADDARRQGAIAATDIGACGDTAQRRAAQGADAGRALVDGHVTDRLDHAHAHRLLALCLAGVVDAGRIGGHGAAGHQGAQGCDHKQFLHNKNTPTELVARLRAAWHPAGAHGCAMFAHFPFAPTISYILIQRCSFPPQ